MASANDVSITISAVDQATDVLNAVQAQLQALQDAASSVDLSNLGGSADLSSVSDQIDAVTSSMGDLTSTAGDVSAAMADAGSAASDASSALTDAGSSASDAASAADSLSSAADTVANATAAAGDAATAAGAGYDVLSQAEDVAATAMQGVADAADTEAGAHGGAGDAASHHADAESKFGEVGRVVTDVLGEMGVPLGALKEGYEHLSEAFEHAAEGGSHFNAALTLTTAGLATIEAGVVLKSADAFVELGDSMHEMEDITGITTPVMQGFGYVLQTMGFSAEDGNRSLMILTRNVQQAQEALDAGQQPAAKFQRALDDLGISLQAFIAMSPDERVRTLMDAFANAPDTVNKTADAFALMGRQGQSMIGALSEGSAALDNGIQKVDQYGASVENSWPKIQAFHTAQANLNTAVEGFEVTVGNMVLPILSDLTDEAARAVGAFDKLPAPIKEGALVTVGLETALLATVVAFQTIVPAIGAATAAGIAFVATPLGATVLAVTGIVAAGVAAWHTYDDAMNKTVEDARKFPDTYNTIRGQIDQYVQSLKQQGGTEEQIIHILEQKRDAEMASQSAGSYSMQTVDAYNGAIVVLRGELEKTAKAQQDLADGTGAASRQIDSARMATQIADGVFTGFRQTLDGIQLDKAFANSPEATIRNLTSAAEGLAQGYRDALTAQTNFFNASTPQQDANKASLAMLNAEHATFNAKLTALPPAMQPVIEAQKKVDDLWQQGNTHSQEYATALQARSQAVATATQTQGTAAVQAALGLQQQDDTTQHLITTQQASNQTIDAWRTALQTAATAAENASPDKQQAAWDNYDRVVKQANDSLGDQATALESDEKAVSTSREAHQKQTDALNAEYDAIRNAKADRKEAADDMKIFGDNAQDTGQKTSGMASTITGALDTVLTKLADSKTKADTTTSTMITDNMAKMQSQAPGIGTSFDLGITAGIQAQAGALAAAAAETVTNAINAAKAAAQISSPSKKTKDEIGQPLGEGVSEGFADWMSSQGAAQMDQATKNVLQHQQDMIAAAKEQISAGQTQARDLTSFGNSITGATRPDALSVSPGQLANDTSARSAALAQMLQAQAQLQQADAQVRADADALAAATTKDEYDRTKAQLDADKQVQQSASTTYQQASSEYQKYVSAVTADSAALKQQAKDLAQFDVTTAAQSAQEKIGQIKGVTQAQVDSANQQITSAQRAIVADKQLYGEYVAAAQDAYAQIQQLQADLLDAEQQGDTERATADANQIQSLQDYITQLSGGTQQIVDDYRRQTEAINGVVSATQQATQAAQQQSQAVQSVAAAAQSSSGGGYGGGSGGGSGPKVEGLGAIFGGPIVTLPDGQQYIGTPAGMNQLAIMQGYANQSALNAQIAAQNTQSTGPIQAGLVSVQVIVGGADPKSSLNVSVV